MLSSIDGKITFGKINGVNSPEFIFEKYMSLYNKTQEKLGTRAILCGRVTMNDFAESVGTLLESIDNRTGLNSDNIHVSGDEGYFFVTDSKGLLRWKENFIALNSEYLSIHKWNLVIIVTSETPLDYLAYLKSKGISYLFAGESSIDFEVFLKKVKEEFKIDTLVLEGGGGINGSMLEDNVVDEISVLCCPFVVNNQNSPSLFDSSADIFRVADFKLKSVEKLEEDVLWVRYER